jgi:adenosylcobinamide-phosphate synthase
MNLATLACALAVEAAFGYPNPLFWTIRHPVVWMGALIAACETRLNRPALTFSARRWRGVAGLNVLLLSVILPCWIAQRALIHTVGPIEATVLLAIAASTLLAQRSLWSHVRDVADGLDRDGLAGGREAVSRIVGRNPQALDEAGVVRAAMESLAENFSDAVVAPAFWCALAGLPGIAFYKAVNTADSMIGHRNERYGAYGWASARLDDVVNLPASRLAALWIVLAALPARDCDARAALRAIWRDAGQHRSPNAGWPEAAMAGALGVRLAGPRVYGTTLVQDGWMGDGRAALDTQDLRRALALYRRACLIQFAVVVGLAIILPG